ncbi:MAG: toll/interleukin-1 receptor domain-containing protein [Hyphomonadaceae bacterium]
MADVFLSYKRQDRGAIEQMATALRALKLDVWFDASLNAGEAFSDEIDREAKAAKAIVVCWSPASAQSKWVKAESLIGFELEKLAAVYVAGPDEFVPPAPFNSLHTEDLRAWLTAPDASAAAWRSVLRRVGRLCGREDIESLSILDTPQTVVRTADVFAEAKPTFTLIDRSHTPEFRRIKQALLGGGKIVRLHGPSKSGKTVLCRQIFTDTTPIVVYGSDITDARQYWTLVAHQCGTTAQDAPLACAQQRRALVIEDFHWIDRDVQAPLIKSLKSFLDASGTAVLLSVPDVAEVFLEQGRSGNRADPILGDLLAKSVAVEPPKWTEQEIRRIGEVGFGALRVVVSDKTLKVLTRFSFKNPLLMQKHCAELCFNMGIDEAYGADTQKTVTEEQLARTFQRIASIDGALFHRIATKNAARPYKLGSGKKLTLRELVLFAITRANINQRIGIARVSQNIARNLNSRAPDRRDIKDAVSELIAEMRKAGQSGLVVDNNHYLYIAHPFFKSYLVWILGPYCGADLPHLEQYVEPLDNESDVEF